MTSFSFPSLFSIVLAIRKRRSLSLLRYTRAVSPKP